MERVILLFNEDLKLGLDLSGYRLIPGYSDQIGLPVEHYLRLYAVRDEENILVSGPEDLARCVNGIHSEAEAWRYLRLFTAPETHYLFQKVVFTIDLEVGESVNTGNGIISPKVANEVAYEAPAAEFADGEYRCARDLIRADPADRLASVAVLRRHEAVSSQGDYRFGEDLMKAEISRNDVVFPSYE